MEFGRDTGCVRALWSRYPGMGQDPHRLAGISTIHPAIIRKGNRHGTVGRRLRRSQSSRSARAERRRVNWEPKLRELLELQFDYVIVSHGEPVHTRAAFERVPELVLW